MGLKYDNVRERFTHGYDAGQILDGTVTLDPERNELVIVDDDGVAFSSQEYLKTLVGKRVRFTCASFETLSTMEQMYRDAQARRS